MPLAFARYSIGDTTMHICPKFKVPVLVSARAQPPGKVVHSAAPVEVVAIAQPVRGI